MSGPSSVPKLIEIVVADDHPIVREALCLVLEVEPDLTVVGQAGDVLETERALVAHRPTVLLLDVMMGYESSLPALPALRQAAPSTAVVILTMEANTFVASDLLRRGVAGYVGKSAESAELIEAVRSAAAGRAYLDPRLGARLAIEHAGESEQLSERDIRILRLVALGHTSSEIAASLYLSARTVEGYRRETQRKLRLSSRAEVVRYVRERRLGG